MEWHQGDFLISTDKSRLNISYVHEYLSNESYWAAGIPIHIVEKSIENSICFGIYKNNTQVGFARLITDEATFGYLADVFVDKDYRGRGLSKWLMKIIIDLPFVSHLRGLMLATKDAHSLYEQFGFTPLDAPERYMRIQRSNVYELMKDDQKRQA